MTNEMIEKKSPEQLGAEIRMYVDAGRRISLLCGIEIGQRLTQAKEMLQHGEWLPWLERETEFSDRTAQRYMKIYRRFGQMIKREENKEHEWYSLPISKAITLLKVPDEELMEFADEMKIEERSVKELDKIVREKYREKNADERLTDKIELKKCPFCGGTAELIISGRRMCGGNIKGYIIVKCTACGSAGKGFYYYGPDVEDWDYTLEESIGGEKAINAWNRRVEA